MNADKKTLTGHLLDMTDDQFQDMLARYGATEPSNTASDEGAPLPSRRELRQQQQQQQQVQAEIQPAPQGFWERIKPLILPAALAIGVVWGLIVTLF